MSDIAALESRISVALDTIGTLLGDFDPVQEITQETLEQACAAASLAARDEAQGVLDAAHAEIEGLRATLAAEQSAISQLHERVATLKAKMERQQEQMIKLETQNDLLHQQQMDDRSELDDLIAALEPLVKENV
ncbi:MAG: chromosome segregation ATPase [Paracoccaceae bacterium]|jgi:chromosome segregation ATPase